MCIMPACVHIAWVLRCIGTILRFFNGERIHVSAEGNTAARTCTFQKADDACANARIGNTKCIELCADCLGGFDFFVARFGDAVQSPTGVDEPILHGKCFF